MQASVAAERPELETPPPLAGLIDPIESALAAGLRYVTDEEPGIRRIRRGKGFTYLDARKRRVQDPTQIARIKKLAIPPAWTDVWICSLANGHLQATGRDARGRKQYRYHTQWRHVRDETKFGRMIAFGRSLAALRERTDRDLSLPGLRRERVLAAVVKLLETTLIRVGNHEYVRQNGSYGLTTLRDRHVDVNGAKLRFEFRGKGGKEHSVEVEDRRLARIVKRCRDLPGQRLFQYLDETGERQSVSSEDVNAYLRETTGEDFTAKDFRTWGGTVLALSELLEAGSDEDGKAAGRAVTEAIQRVAGALGNRPAICRKYYIHPLVIEAFLQGSLARAFEEDVEDSPDPDEHTGLRRLEAQLLALLGETNGSAEGAGGR